MGGDGPGIRSPLLGVRQVAELLRVSVDFVYSTMKRNVPHVKVGGALRFRKEDIDRYIAMQTVSPMAVRDIKSPISLRELMRKPDIQSCIKSRKTP